MNPHRGKPEDITEAYHRGLMHSVGYRRKDLEKPQIAIVNSWTEVNPGHQPLRELAARVKEGVWAAGGCPCEFNVPAPCDGMAQGSGMHYILPQRDLIAASVEAMVQAHGFEAVVMLGSCDKIIPGMLMAAIRLNLPTLFLTAGAMMPCRLDEKRTVVTPDLKEAIGTLLKGEIDQETFLNWQERFCATPGTCSMMGTANSMGCFLEATGLAPFGSATMLTFDAAKNRQARDVGERIVELVREGRALRDVLTAENLENGIRYLSASGSSTNAVLHLMACASLLDLGMDLADFDKIQSSVPVVGKFKPSSEFNINDYHEAGGVLALLGAIRERLHLEIEAMRLAFADVRWYVADPAYNAAPLEWLLSKEYAAERRRLIDPQRATLDQRHGTPVAASDTVYLSVADGEGNACSFINSNYMGFGTGIVPHGWGFTLQNRGHNFSLDARHPNALAPGKRPYHTIIPAMAAGMDGTLYASFGVMGGFMQPQGHLQVALALIADGLDPQAALDRPRFCIMDGIANGTVGLEEGIPPPVTARLEAMGHPVMEVKGYGRGVFGRGQVIRRDPASGVLWAGSDPRADGCAMCL